MTLTPTVDEACKCKVAIAGTKNELFAFQTHPKVDKKAYEASSTLQLKDLSKGFPKGKPVGVLRWSMSTQDDDQVQATPSHHSHERVGARARVRARVRARARARARVRARACA